MGFMKMNEINDDLSKQQSASEKSGDFNLLSVMSDNTEAGLGKMNEIERQIYEVSQAIEAMARKMSALPPEFQQSLREHAAFMAKQGEPAYEMFLAKTQS